MKAPHLLLISTLLSSSALLSDTYMCNLDFFEDDARDGDVLNSNVTAIFHLETCRAGHKSIFEEELGPFMVQIHCQNNVEISVKPGRKEIIRGNYAEKRSLEYLHKGAGLRINCQGLDLQKNVEPAEHPQLQKTPSSNFTSLFWAHKPS